LGCLSTLRACDAARRRRLRTLGWSVAAAAATLRFRNCSIVLVSQSVLFHSMYPKHPVTRYITFVTQFSSHVLRLLPLSCGRLIQMPAINTESDQKTAIHSILHWERTAEVLTLRGLDHSRSLFSVTRPLANILLISYRFGCLEQLVRADDPYFLANAELSAQSSCESRTKLPHIVNTPPLPLSDLARHRLSWIRLLQFWRRASAG